MPGVSSTPTLCTGACPSSTPTASPSPASAAVTKLARYTIDPKKIFVAGISSGGFGAVQMHVAHSTVFKGAAVYAGGVYWCAQGATSAQALVSCGGETVSTGTGSRGSALYESTLSLSETYLDLQSSMGTIDNESNIKNAPVYLWSGTNDEVVNPKEMADLDTEYLHYGANVHFDSTYPADHGWESPDGELACGTLGTPYMLSCPSATGTGAYDSVQTWLQMFLGTLQPRNGGALAGKVLSFDQTEFGANAASLSLANTGSVFVPKDCAQGKTCGFILAEHGCLQEASLVGTKWVDEAGIDEWADTNDLVVLYPDTVADAAGSGFVLNPNGCFDWWGYSNGEDVNYSLKNGAQMSAILRHGAACDGRGSVAETQSHVRTRDV